MHLLTFLLHVNTRKNEWELKKKILNGLVYQEFAALKQFWAYGHAMSAKESGTKTE